MTQPLKTQGPLGQKLLRHLRRFRRSQGVDLGALKAASQESQQLLESLPDRELLQSLDPAHAPYVFLYNRVSLLAEVITSLEEFEPLVQLITRAEDAYMPEGPPISPLTRSYFGMWAYFDAAAGSYRETLGTCLLGAGSLVGLAPEFLQLLQTMQDSRLGLYVHEGTEGPSQVLRELVTGEQKPYVVPSGYSGKPGEVWLARALPPPSPAFAHGVVFTTPYVMRGHGEREWHAFLQRTLPKLKSPDEPSAYAALMKWGLSSYAWHEYIFQAYAGHDREAVYLTGLPDITASRPHGQNL
jgi:hypothetical protein